MLELHYGGETKGLLSGMESKPRVSGHMLLPVLDLEGSMFSPGRQLGGGGLANSYEVCRRTGSEGREQPEQDHGVGCSCNGEVEFRWSNSDEEVE